ncbi:HPr kinase/phosphatase C-terminal domain-containing protein [Sphingomonas sp.]|uniref:HPr kinase/phosphorylase n=1 Tax=Sphingomonas sp. TaxID=28214 RepID=UPI00333F1CCF
MTPLRLHATSVAIGAHGVLLTGPSGAGKSDLALRLIDRGATLISDDQTELTLVDGCLLAAAPATIAGQIEVRGLGIVAVAQVSDIPVALVVTLGVPLERMPPNAVAHVIAGIALPAVALDAFEGSAPIKVELALRRATMTL